LRGAQAEWRKDRLYLRGDRLMPSQETDKKPSSSSEKPSMTSTDQDRSYPLWEERLLAGCKEEFEPELLEFKVN
jgi:hypothetical protein